MDREREGLEKGWMDDFSLPPNQPVKRNPGLYICVNQTLLFAFYNLQ